jgi:hypothetical protein
MRGSTAIHGAIDSALYFDECRNDGAQRITNVVRSEIKGAASAGKFGLTLDLVDDDNREAVRATWTVDQVGVEEREKDDVDKLLEHVMTLTEPTTWSKIRPKLGNGQDADKARDRAVAQGRLKVERRGNKIIIHPIAGLAS